MKRAQFFELIERGQSRRPNSVLLAQPGSFESQSGGDAEICSGPKASPQGHSGMARFFKADAPTEATLDMAKVKDWLG